MDRINGANTVDIGGGRRGFRSEDLVNGLVGTEVTSLHMNAMQEEIMKVIEEANLVPHDGDWSQLWQALKILGVSVGALARRWMAVVSMTTTAPPGAPADGDAYLVPAGATGAWATQVGKVAAWTGSAWSYMSPPDGHGISLPDGRIFERVAGAYIEKVALDAQSGKWNYAAAGGTANALTATLAPVPGSLASLTGASIKLKIAAANTGAVTLAVNGFAATAVKNPDGNQLVAGQMAPGSVVDVVYNGAFFELHTVASYGVGFGRLSSFTAGGNFVVPAGVYRVRARVWGGGGGSGGAYNGGNSGGGGGGGYAEGFYDVLPGDVIPITVGAGGAAGGATTSPTNGGFGGSSSFGAFCSASGGGGGVAAAASNVQAAGGAGGIGAGGTLLNVEGGSSSGGLFGGPGAGGGNGGASFAIPPIPSGGYGGAGVSGKAPGGGAGGTGANTLGANYTGGAGGAGRVIVEY